MHKGQGYKKNTMKTPRDHQGMGHWFRPTGGGADVRSTEKGRGRDHHKGENLGSDRELGTGQGWKMGGNRTKDMSFTGTRRGTPGAGRDLGSRLKTAWEASTGKSSGGQRGAETSRWTDNPRPGELVGRSGLNIEKWGSVKR